MEEKKKVKSLIITIIVVIILLLLIGGVCWYVYANRNNNNNTAQNTSNEVNTTENTNTADPYANYKNFAWIRTTSITYTEWLSDTYNNSAWIDNSGITHISYTYKDNPKEEVTVNSLKVKAKYITAMPVDPQNLYNNLLVLGEDNSLYVISNLNENNASYDAYNPDIVGPLTLNNNPNVTKIASDILEIYRDDTNNIPTVEGPDSADSTFIGVYALTKNGQLLSINSSNYYADNPTYVLGLSYEEMLK